MKPLVILTRILCVGLFWSLFFIEGVRVIMLRNWHFDMFQSSHWSHAWNLWLSGWVVKTPKEWAFVLIILTFIPLWLSGWAALSMVKWEKTLTKVARYPWQIFKQFFFRPVKIITTSSGMKNIKKKKSYKEVRPRSLRLPLDERPEPENTTSLIATKNRATSTPQTTVATSISPNVMPAAPQSIPVVESKPLEVKQFSHSLFDMDSKDDDFDFNIDDFDFTKSDEEEEVKTPAPVEKKNDYSPKKNLPQKKDNSRELAPRENKPRNNKNRDNQNLPSNPRQSQTSAPKGSGNSVLDVIKQHGFDTINGVMFKGNLIDFVCVAKNQIVLCLLDKETGDWLADEERFNDEEPLWFSESSHRISPVRKVDVARKVLSEVLENQGMKFSVNAFVIVSIGNIINAEDMFDVWNDLKVNVTRIDRGTPKEIKLFAKALPEAVEPISKDDFEKVKKVIRNLA